MNKVYIRLDDGEIFFLDKKSNCYYNKGMQEFKGKGHLVNLFSENVLESLVEEGKFKRVVSNDLQTEELEDFAFYESGLSADGCLEKLDDYTRKAIEKYGRILLGKQNQDFIDGFEGCCYCCEPVGLLNQKLEKEIEKYKHILNSRQVKDIYLQTSANEKIKTLEKLVEQKTKDAEELKEMYLKEIANLEPYKFGVEEQKKYIKILEEKIKNLDTNPKDDKIKNNMKENLLKEFPEKDNIDVKLHNTTDAQIWSDEFIKTLRKVFPEVFGYPKHLMTKQRYEDFKEWVFGWFCNAIQTGIDLTHNKRNKQYIYILQCNTGGIVDIYTCEPEQHDMNSSYSHYIDAKTAVDASENCMLYRYSKYAGLQCCNGKAEPDTRYNWKNL